MALRTLLLARDREDTSSLWYAAVKEGEDRANVTLSPILEEHLVTTLKSNIKDANIGRPVALSLLEAIESKNDILSLIITGGRCLIIAGLFPELARRRNVRTGYFVRMGQSAYQSHATYWEGRGAFAHALASTEVAKNFLTLVATLRGMKNSSVITEDLSAVYLPEKEWN